MDSSYENMRKAIDVMTAWATDDPNSTKFSVERAASYASEAPDGETQLLIGLINLSGNLLVRLEHETNKSMQWHLQDIAAKTLDK